MCNIFIFLSSKLLKKYHVIYRVFFPSRLVQFPISLWLARSKYEHTYPLSYLHRPVDLWRKTAGHSGGGLIIVTPSLLIRIYIQTLLKPSRRLKSNCKLEASWFGLFWNVLLWYVECSISSWWIWTEKYVKWKWGENNGATQWECIWKKENTDRM